MLVKDILEVYRGTTTIYPAQIGDAHVPLVYAYDSDLDKLKKSFESRLKERVKSHEKLLKIDKYKDLEGYGILERYVSIGKRVFVLNRNIDSFDELLSLEVDRIRTYGCQGGASHLEIMVKDIQLLDEFFK